MSRAEDTVPDKGEFVSSTEPLRRELMAHCYRMLGSVDEAEDMVQETYLRAWRAYDAFEGRSSVRSWLYRIATNVCLTALQHRSRRVLPSGLGAPAEDPDAPIVVAGPEVSWLQPIPDVLVQSGSDDPAVIVTVRESLRLALIASLQYLSPRQRAVLILRDVLAWSAPEVAEVFGVSNAAVKSTLQRARARLEEVAPTADEVTEPTEPERRALLDQYIAAFERSDLAALERALCHDATLEVTPSRTWFAGLKTCMPYFARYAIGSPGDWRAVPTAANGQPAAVAYRRDEAGVYRAFAIVVLTVSTAGIARITLFSDLGLLDRFGLPQVLED